MRRLLAPIPIAVLCAVVALVALLAYGLASNEKDRTIDHAVAAGERDPAPDIELPKLQSSGTASLADYRGKVVVLNYWASWCPPCRDESPLLERWHRRLAKSNATVPSPRSTASPTRCCATARATPATSSASSACPRRS
jgi:cytochrome c biogenesis protein CcmG, thiol:disulfide interchange protein DsbE